MNYILSHNRTIAILHETELGDRIVECENRILFLRKNYTYFWSKNDIESIIHRRRSESLNNPKRIYTTDYYTQILNLIKGFEREQKIEDVLCKEENKETLWLAC